MLIRFNGFSRLSQVSQLSTWQQSLTFVSRREVICDDIDQIFGFIMSMINGESEMGMALKCDV